MVLFVRLRGRCWQAHHSRCISCCCRAWSDGCSRHVWDWPQAKGTGVAGGACKAAGSAAAALSVGAPAELQPLGAAPVPGNTGGPSPDLLMLAGEGAGGRMGAYKAAGKERTANQFVKLALDARRSCTKAGQQKSDRAWAMWTEFLGSSFVDVREQAGTGQCGMMLKGKVLVPNWPPSIEVWLAFHHFVRVSVSSHAAYVCVLNFVATTGRHTLLVECCQHGVMMVAQSLDPSVLYSCIDRRMRGIMAKQHKKAVKKVAHHAGGTQRAQIC